MNDKIQESLDKQQELEKMIDQMGINVSKDIYVAVRKATSHLVKASMNDENNPQGTGASGGGGGGSLMSEEMKTVL